MEDIYIKKYKNDTGQFIQQKYKEVAGNLF